MIKLRGKDAKRLVHNEMAELEEEKLKMSQVKEVSWSDMFTKRHLVRPLVVTVGVQLLQQFSGINAVI